MYSLLVQIPLVCPRMAAGCSLGIGWHWEYHPVCPSRPLLLAFFFFFSAVFWFAVEVRDDNFHPVNEQETLGQDRKLHQGLGEKSQEGGKEKKKCKKTALLVKGRKCQGGGEKRGKQRRRDAALRSAACSRSALVLFSFC